MLAKFVCSKGTDRAENTGRAKGVVEEEKVKGIKSAEGGK